MIKPMLAHVYEPHRVTYPCYVQPKLNGIRAIWGPNDKGGTSFLSRDGHVFHERVLAHINGPLQEVFGRSVVLDGELYVHGWPLQRINGAVTPVRQEPNEDTVKVEYHVFDVVDFNKSFDDRQSLRHKLWFESSSIPIKLVETWQPQTAAIADRYYASFVFCGYEGMMYRLGDCPYTVPKQLWVQQYNIKFNQPRTKFLSDKNNRTWHLLKRKDWQDDEFHFVSLNATTGEKGERGFQMWCKSHSGADFKVSSGLTQNELDHYLANPPYGRLIKVKYLVLSSDSIPLNATILAIL